MRFHSTLESVQKGEITKLAIIECFVSVAIYVGISIHFKTFRYFAIAIALAPLTLFRTEASVQWGLKMYARLSTFLLMPFLSGRSDSFMLMGFLPALLGYSGLAIRFAATLFWSVRRPLETLRQVPQNWLRQALCTDVFYPPEVIPSETTYEGDILTFSYLWKGLREGLRIGRVNISFIGLFVVPFCLIAFVPPLYYRITFKATSLVYYPFVWVAGLTVGSTESLKTRLERFTKGELEKTRRWVSGLVATALAMKVGLILGWMELPDIVAKFSSKKFVESFLVPHVWHWWQITLGIDALLTFCLLYYADAALGRLDTKDAWDSESVARTVSCVSFLRASLAIVTMSHFFWLAFTTTTGRYITF
jgi:hypothetical protein